MAKKKKQQTDVEPEEFDTPDAARGAGQAEPQGDGSEQDDDQFLRVLRYPEDIEYKFEVGHPLYDPRAYQPVDQSLANSIFEEGLLDEIKIRSSPDKEGVEQIIDGRRRQIALLSLNERRVSAGLPRKKYAYKLKLGAAEPATAARLKHIFNEQRLPRDPMGRAEGMVELVGYGYTHEDVAGFFKVTTKTVQRAVKLVKKGTEKLKAALREEKVTLSDALETANLVVADQDGVLEKLLKIREAGEKVKVADLIPDTDGGEDGEGGDDRKPKKKKWRKSPRVEKFFKELKKSHVNGKHASEIKEAVDAAFQYVSGGNPKPFFELMASIGIAGGDDGIEIPD